MRSETEKMVEAVEILMAEGWNKAEAVEKVTAESNEFIRMVVEMGLEK